MPKRLISAALLLLAAMAVPAMWWTVGLAGHALAVLIVALVGHYEKQQGPA